MHRVLCFRKLLYANLLFPLSVLLKNELSNHFLLGLPPRLPERTLSCSTKAVPACYSVDDSNISSSPKPKLLKIRDRPTLDSSNSVSRSLLNKVEESAGLHTPPSVFCLQPSPLLSLCTSLMLMLVSVVSLHKKSRPPGHCSLPSACFLDPISFQGHSFS